VASAVTHATNGFTYDVLTLHLKTILHSLVVLKTGIARNALVIVTEDKDNYQYEERDTMNKQMKNGNSSLLHKDKDTKNKQMKRDSSSLEITNNEEITLTITKLLLWLIVNCGALMRFLIVISLLVICNISPNAREV